MMKGVLPFIKQRKIGARHKVRNLVKPNLAVTKSDAALSLGGIRIVAED